MTQRGRQRSESRTAQLEGLERLLKGAFPDAEMLAYVDYRWVPRVTAANRKRNREMRRYYWARGAALLGAAVVPILATTSTQASGTMRSVLSYSAAAVSLLVAVATVYLQVARVGERWQLNRTLLVALESEAWQAVTAHGGYAALTTPVERYGLFVDNSERYIRDAEDRYLAEVASLVPSVPSGEDQGSTSGSVTRA